MPNDMSTSYTERLFSKGLRSKLHLSRFFWLRKSTKAIETEINSVLEIGCNDGKTLDYLPEFPPIFTGIDANWGGGLDQAINKYGHLKDYSFIQAKRINQISLIRTYDISICMETLEHIPPKQVRKYLDLLVNHTERYIFITIPNEIGLLFAIKYLIKAVTTGVQKISLAEYFLIFFKNTKRVKRRGHIGFDYREIIMFFKDKNIPITLERLPFGFLPNTFAFTFTITVDLTKQ